MLDAYRIDLVSETGAPVLAEVVDRGRVSRASYRARLPVRERRRRHDRGG
jgi:hypothetical protein